MFTPIPFDDATRSYFQERDIEHYDDTRLRFMAIADDAYLSESWQDTTVMSEEGVSYPVQVRRSDCGSSCQCAAQIRLPDQSYPRQGIFLSNEQFEFLNELLERAADDFWHMALELQEYTPDDIARFTARWASLQQAMQP